MYGRLLATPTWYYANGRAAEFKRVLAALAGDTSGGVPLYASVLRSVLKRLLPAPKSRPRALGLLTALAKAAGHWQVNLVQLYRVLGKRLDFDVVVAPGAATLADQAVVPIQAAG